MFSFQDFLLNSNHMLQMLWWFECYSSKRLLLQILKKSIENWKSGYLLFQAVTIVVFGRTFIVWNTIKCYSNSYVKAFEVNLIGNHFWPIVGKSLNQWSKSSSQILSRRKIYKLPKTPHIIFKFGKVCAEKVIKFSRFI